MNALSRFVLALLLFQIALMGLLVNDRSGASISANQVATLVQARPIAIGQAMPSFEAYNDNGSAVRVLRDRQLNILVFATCQCQISSAEAVTGGSDSGNYYKALLLMDSPQKLDSLCRQNSWNVPAFAMRLNEMTPLLRGYKPPVIVTVSQEGVVLSVTDASSPKMSDRR